VTLWKSALAKLKPYAGILFMMIASMSFSTMSMLIKIGSDAGVPTFELLFTRNLCMLIVCVVILGWRRENPLKNRANILPLLLRGFLAFFGQTLYFMTLARLDVPTAVTLTFTSPVLSSLIAVPMLKEKVTIYDAVGVLMCLLGVVMITRPIDLFTSQLDVDRLIGIAMALAGACFASVSTCEKKNEKAISDFFFLVFVVLFLFFLFFKDKHDFD
jgi:drug/metabolite transporter (DMT)-like permease